MMDKSKLYGLSGVLFGLIGIDVAAHHDLLPGLAMFTLAVGCALRARREWMSGHA
jgi:hypothetical protein